MLQPPTGNCWAPSSKSDQTLDLWEIENPRFTWFYCYKPNLPAQMFTASICTRLCDSQRKGGGTVVTRVPQVGQYGSFLLEIKLDKLEHVKISDQAGVLYLVSVSSNY